MVVISVVYLIVQAIIYFSVSNESKTSGNNATEAPSTTIIVILAVFGIPISILLLVLIGFLIFHCVLKARGKTTREFVKDRRVNTEKKPSQPDPELGNQRELQPPTLTPAPGSSPETHPIGTGQPSNRANQAQIDAVEDREGVEIASDPEENDTLNMTPVYLDFSHKLTKEEADRIAQLKL